MPRTMLQNNSNWQVQSTAQIQLQTQSNMWNKETFLNTVLKTATITSAVIFYLSSVTLPEGLQKNFIEPIKPYTIEICLGAAFFPEALKFTKLVTYDYPAIGAALGGVWAGLFIQKKFGLA